MNTFFTHVRFIVWPEDNNQYGARADVLDHPWEHLSAFAPTPQEALRRLVEDVIPSARVTKPRPPGGQRA